MTALKKDPYSLLEIQEGADLSEIKRAYRRLVRKFHPDVCGRSMKNIRKFLEIKDAYNLLIGERSSSARALNSSHLSPDTKINDGAFVFVRIEALQAINGAEIDLEITDREAFCPKCSGLGRYASKISDICRDCSGTGYKILPWAGKRLKVICSGCNGTGAADLKPCSLCRGKGKIFLQRRITLKVPMGIKDGTILKLHGQGPWDPARNKRTTLFVEIEVKLPEGWKIEGRNIISCLEIDCWTHLGGGYVSCRTINGVQKVFITPGAVRDNRLVLKGHGWIDEDGTRGDHIFLISVSYPPAPCPREAVKLLTVLRMIWPAEGYERRAIPHKNISKE